MAAEFAGCIIGFFLMYICPVDKYVRARGGLAHIDFRYIMKVPSHVFCLPGARSRHRRLSSGLRLHPRGKKSSSYKKSLSIPFFSKVYPTSMRAIGLGMCSTVARLGSMSTPFIAQVRVF